MTDQPSDSIRVLAIHGRLGPDGVEPFDRPRQVALEFTEDAEAYEPEERLEP